MGFVLQRLIKEAQPQSANSKEQTMDHPENDPLAQ